MYEMIIEDNQPLVRNGTPYWTRPIVDEKGTLFVKQHQAAKKHGIAQSQVSKAVRENREVNGHKFRYAKVAEVKANLGDKVTLIDAAQTPEKKPKKGKAGRKAKTIHVDGPLEALEMKTLFEGHVFTGGPAVLILPGTTFRMERPTKDDFPRELRDACRWT